ncbi:MULTISPECIES: heme ABC exporter ATP-binding protein CcmA [Halocynthiibacter]|uniref:Heme ABC exporter ATP-binding protein CcmA n=1 Tax=Halocynthiibacter halioticoli TaxID=2986804 RepID=A0AAE3IXH0_9RHOB|nr:MULTISPECIES: heme ABC exporter ATP-binding protein CcmA [Halocynthiibacter]MCV6824047.1 heme ABC exporter ATP-binding protein CcmA [Halocynthiibacter halioticoli]MCW4057048.1 heme ABC exporter ATP-binding protein CcmA [Halocynthiibacter sp. SDUM655004]
MTLEVQSVAVQRGSVPVLAGVDFALPAGEALFLRGPNGIGKTTLLRCIAGLQPPLSGVVRMANGGAATDEIAYASHADGVKPTLTVAENLSFWASVFGASGIDAALETFDLVELRNRAAQNLSAGQKRRLGLARMLVTGRNIWAMDEPTVSLDAAATANFARVVQDHLARGGSALIATHIDLGFDAKVLDLTPFKATTENAPEFDEAFL